jgi:hypothetical protein
MAISSADIAALPDYTDAQLLKLYRWALANGAAGTSRSINGRAITFPALPSLLSAIEWLEERVQAASDGTGGSIALVQFGETA